MFPGYFDVFLGVSWVAAKCFLAISGLFWFGRAVCLVCFCVFPGYFWMFPGYF